MPLMYEVPGPAGGVVTRRGNDDGAVGLLLTLTNPAPPKLRRQYGLAAGASMAHALAAAGGAAPDAVNPLTVISSGIYTEKDYLAQFEEPWEVEEYGHHAGKVVAKNLAAWQAPGPLGAALDVAIAAIPNARLAEALFGVEQARASLLTLRKTLKKALSLGAARVCLELDDDI